MKQVIIIRKDLGMSPGKAAAQACHASLTAYLRTEKSKASDAKRWYNDGQTKIIVMVENEEELVALHDLLDKDPQLTDRIALIRDAGHTELEGQNLTTLGIGPCDPKVVDPYTRKLLLYR